MTKENEMPDYQFPEIEDMSNQIIAAIGVGGGGSNAVRHMFREDVRNVTFIVCNTDSQALSKSEVPRRLQLGEDGLGVGGNPQKGREAAEKSIEDIRKIIPSTTQMVFITAGMGGGTGTGAAPVIARVAREMGMLTVGVVTLPFVFEKRKRIRQALIGLEEMKKNVDSLLVINNQKLAEIYSDNLISIKDAFAKTDDVLTTATKTISDIITKEGTVNRDFCDVKTVMEHSGQAVVAVGTAKGEDRILKAMTEALTSPLLSNVDTSRTKKMLYIIYSGEKHPVMMQETMQLNSFMEQFDDNIEVQWGLYDDPSLDEEVKVAIVATGFDQDENETGEKNEDDIIRHGLSNYYKGLSADLAPLSPVSPNLSKEEEDHEDETDEEQTAQQSWFDRIVSHLKAVIEEDEF